MPPSISVVVCTHTEDRWPLLLSSIESLRRQTTQPLEIVVAVDHNSALWGRARRMPGVVACLNQDVRGLSGTRNAGLRASRGEIVAFLDDDAQAAPDWLDVLGRPYADQAVVGVGGLAESSWQNGRPWWFPQEFDWVVGCAYTGLPTDQRAVRNLIGCNMSFRREALEAVGGFNPGVGRVGAQTLGREDDETELCIRVAQRWPGCDLIYTPQARVIHHVPASRSSWRYFVARCYSEGMSKAYLAQAVGSKDGLSSEWAYTLRTLPAGFAINLRNPVRRLGRSAAIVGGLAVATTGYGVGLLRALKRRSSGDEPLHLNPASS
jgi:glycosyltransferase involved in cell wall biosynthesis